MPQPDAETIDRAPVAVRELYRLACAARENAYSPYSSHKVGAAIRLADGSVHTGCNVENASLGATVCAERVAVQKAISEKGHIRVTEVMVVTDASPAWPPCGLCRQVLSEFTDECAVYCANLAGDLRATTFRDLCPDAMTPEWYNR